jgi:hypothetical protein
LGILKLSAEVRSLPEEGRPAYRQVGFFEGKILKLFSEEKYLFTLFIQNMFL